MPEATFSCPGLVLVVIDTNSFCFSEGKMKISFILMATDNYMMKDLCLINGDRRDLFSVESKSTFPA